MKHYEYIDDIGMRIVNYKPFHKFTRKDLAELRSQVRLGSIYISDYRNSKGIEENYCSDFFDAYYEYLYELAEKSGEVNMNDMNVCSLITDKFDNIDTLVEFHANEWNCENVSYAVEIYVGTRSTILYADYHTAKFVA